MKIPSSVKGEYKHPVSCIIPCYNESSRILGVLREVSKVKEFNQIICVNDGSIDNSKIRIRNSEFINKQIYPNFEFIHFQKNRGKTAAIKKGLALVKNPLVFCVDGDLVNLQHKELQTAIDIMQKNEKIAMIILCRVNSKLQKTWQWTDNIFSGERILRTADLKTILATKPKPVRFQIEVAINQYMMKKKKKVYWIPSSAISYFKRKKYGGIIKGEAKDIQMHFQMMKYIGLHNYLKQFLFIYKKQYQPSNFAN